MGYKMLTACMLASAILMGCSSDDDDPAAPGETATNQVPVADIAITSGNMSVAISNGRAEVVTNSLINLDGATSSDPDSDNLTYQWTISLPAGSTVQELTDATMVTSSFTPDVDGDYTVTLVVNDGELDSQPVSITISASSTANIAPVANAGDDQTVATGSEVTLDGSASSDLNTQDTLSYQWSLTTPATGSALTELTDSAMVNARFTPDVDGDYVITLVVSDGNGGESSDEVVITATTANLVPVANAGPAQTVDAGAMVTLDGSHSSDGDGDDNALMYTWTLLSSPDGSQAVLSSTTEVAPSFTADMVGEYILELVVSDGIDQSDAASVTITAIAVNDNIAPVANAGSAVNVVSGTEVVLDGSGSSDADGDPLTYVWSVTNAPTGSNVVTGTLTAADSVSPSFTPDLNGDYTLTLVVNDGTSNSEAATVIVSAFSGISQHVEDIQAAFLAVPGNDFTAPASPFTLGIANGTVELLGYAYCLPSDPTAAPGATSTPPTTVYGCDNNLTVTHTVSADSTSVVFTWEIPTLFVDGQGTVSALVTNIDYEAYVNVGTVTVTAEVMLVDAGNGLYEYDATAQAVMNMDYATVQIVVDNSTLQNTVSSAENQAIMFSHMSPPYLDYVAAQLGDLISTQSAFLLD